MRPPGGAYHLPPAIDTINPVPISHNARIFEYYGRGYVRTCRNSRVPIGSANLSAGPLARSLLMGTVGGDAARYHGVSCSMGGSSVSLEPEGSRAGIVRQGFDSAALRTTNSHRHQAFECTKKTSYGEAKSHTLLSNAFFWQRTVLRMLKSYPLPQDRASFGHIWSTRKMKRAVYGSGGRCNGSDSDGCHG